MLVSRGARRSEILWKESQVVHSACEANVSSCHVLKNKSNFPRGQCNIDLCSSLLDNAGNVNVPSFRREQIGDSRLVGGLSIW